MDFFHYSSPQKSFIPPGCDCSLYNQKITSSTASKHTATLPGDEHTVYMSSIIPTVKPKQNKLTGAKTDKSFIEQDVIVNKSYNQIKKRYTYFPQLLNERQELPLHLFLDIDITSENSNSPQLEEVKNMFESFQAAEKNLSECIDLHIYIFSKSIGGRVPNKNLSSIRQLTEIENKCDQLASIIKKSIYQIKQSLSREDNTNELAQDVQDTVNTADSNKETEAQYATNEFGHGNTATDMYPNALATNPTDDIYSTATETADTVANKMDKLQFDNKNLQHANHNFSYDELLVKNNEITSTISFYEDSTVYNKVKLTAFTDTTAYGELEATSKTGRKEFNEKDMIIPRIITKEFSNDTLMSVVNGYENITNSDFINNTIISTPSNNESNSNLDLIKSNIDKIVQSDIVNIYGNLYFSFGDKQIPARFIQQSDGQINVAIDGISMCHQFQGNHTSKFMNSLCKCMIHKNCK